MQKRLSARHFLRSDNLVEHLEPRRLLAMSYSVLEVGSSAVGVSDSGIVVGQVSHGAFANAMYYDGTLHELPSPAGPGVSSRALGVNNLGQVVGAFDNGFGISSPFLFSSNIIVDLTNRGVSTVNAINDADLVTGTLGKPSKTLDGPAYFMGAGGGTYTRLQSIRPRSPSEGLAINATGRIVGWSDLPSASGANLQHAYDFFTHTDFGPGSDNAVNNNGDSAGYIVTTAARSATTAFLALNGSRVILGTLGGSSSKAYGVNDADEVVGSSDMSTGGATHAFIYRNGNMVDLNTLIDPSLHVTLTDAFAINNSGQVAGTLTDAAGGKHGYLLTPISSNNPGTLTPTIKTTTLPTSIITGQSAHGVVNLSITNATGAAERGRASLSLFLSTGASVDASSISIGRISTKINLRARASRSFTLSITKLPRGIPSGNYRLLAQAIDPAGKTSTVAAALPISIATPHVALSATIVSVTPRTAARGGSAVAAMLLTNAGNISASGMAEVDFGYTIDGSTEAASIVKTTRPLRIGPAKSGKLRVTFVVPKSLKPGTYTPIVTITESGSTTTAVSPKTWTVS